MALAAYRHVLRATRIAFFEDYQLLHAARSQAREGFERQSSLDPSSQDAVKAIEHAEGVAQILQHNIVQGKAGADPNLLKLRIHDQIEKGDNDTVKNPRAPGGKVKVGGI